MYDLVWTEGANGRRVLYRDVFHQNEVEQSTYNFEHSSAQMLFAHFNDYEAEAKRLMDVPLALPAYEATLKAAHTFNMLDARGAISVTELRRLHRPHPQPVARRRPGLLRLPRAAGLSHAGSRPGRRGDCINDDEHPPLLVELLTEELPPKALQKLGQAYAEGVRATLARHGLLADGCATEAYATPRRLAVRLSAVLAQAPDQAYAEKLMPVKIGLTEDGQATPALQRSWPPRAWKTSTWPRWNANPTASRTTWSPAAPPRRRAGHGLQEGIAAAIDSLPIPKVMRYQLADGVTTVKFVRPAHGLIALHGADVVPVTALGLAAGRETLGHRFMSNGSVAIPDADAYAATLADKGRVMASFEGRRADIERQLLDTPAACPPRWATIRKSPRCWTKSPRWSSIPPSTWASSRNNSCKCRRNA